MKIKRDFITNSSSTSFILAFQGEFSREKILSAFGVEKDSLMQDFFDSLIYDMERDIMPAKEYCARYESGESYKEFIVSRFGQEAIDRINELETEGFTIYMGRLSSDESMMEVFLCTESFLIDEKGIYINGKDNAW